MNPSHGSNHRFRGLTLTAIYGAALIYAILAALHHPAWIFGPPALGVSVLIVRFRRASELRRFYDQIYGDLFSDYQANTVGYLSYHGIGRTDILLHFHSMESARRAISEGAIRELGRILSSKNHDWDLKIFFGEEGEELPIELPFDKGTHESTSSSLRTIAKRGTLIVLAFMLAGFFMNNFPDSNLPLGTKSITLTIVTLLGIVAWLYLETWDFLQKKRSSSPLFRWKLAAIAAHPGMLPIYFIVIPITTLLVYLWIIRNGRS